MILFIIWKVGLLLYFWNSWLLTVPLNLRPNSNYVIGLALENQCNCNECQIMGGGAVSDFMKRNLFSIKKGKFDDVMEISLKGATLIVQRHLLLASPAPSLPACLPPIEWQNLCICPISKNYLFKLENVFAQISKNICSNWEVYLYQMLNIFVKLGKCKN